MFHIFTKSQCLSFSGTIECTFSDAPKSKNTMKHVVCSSLS